MVQATEVTKWVGRGNWVTGQNGLDQRANSFNIQLFELYDK